jgi:hypothetical protein
MITSLNEWKKQHSKNNGINEIAVENSALPDGIPGKQTDPVSVPHANVDTMNNIIKIGEYAKSLELTKQQTIDIVSTIFIDPAQAPEDISVAFVQDHLGEIVQYIESLPDTDFAEATYQYTQDMETNDLPFECAMYAPNNAKIAQLTESLNTQIKKNNFKAIYENGIFFINSLDKLNENNKNVVLNILKECKAKNISNSLKWKRKLV